MASLLFIVPILLVIYVLNSRREKDGRKQIPEELAFPIGLFIIMCVILFEIHADIPQAIIVFIFGAVIGETFDRALNKERK